LLLHVKGDFTGYLIYDLPFGRGKQFGANMNRAADAAVGGWKLSLMPTFRGGFLSRLAQMTTTPGPTPSKTGRIA